MAFLKKHSASKEEQRQSEEGFTMVELLVVLAIIGLIASFAVPQVLRYLETARIDAARIQIGNIESAMELFYIDNSAYPDTKAGLAALSIRPDGASRWHGPYMKKADRLLDPWGHPYEYELDEASGGVVIISLGADGKTGGEDAAKDISNLD